MQPGGLPWAAVSAAPISDWDSAIFGALGGLTLYLIVLIVPPTVAAARGLSPTPVRKSQILPLVLLAILSCFFGGVAATLQVGAVTKGQAFQFGLLWPGVLASGAWALLQLDDAETGTSRTRRHDPD